MRVLFLLLFFIPIHFVTAQSASEFRSPLDIPILLSGTFAELRSNHFHGGMDIKTNGKQGYRIYAIKEGFISRIKVSSRGYGNALYVQHPNGYTSVYAHLKSFNENIESYVKQRQYQSMSFDQDIYLSPSELVVSSGDVIAFSGNSGSSAGPHLHFELRKTNGQIPINPMVFLPVKDDINPTIRGLRVHELTNSFYHANNKTYSVKYISPGVYQLSEPVVVNQSVVGFSIKAIDKQNGTSNNNGFVTLEQYVDGVLNFAFTKDEVAYDQTRYLNAHIDYPAKKNGKGMYTNCFKLKGNRLPFYRPGADDGRIWLSQYPERNIEIKVIDFVGNTSTLSFKLIYQANEDSALPTHDGVYFPYSQANSFYEQGIQVYLPDGSLYDDIFFQYKLNPAITTSLPVYSDIHQVHDEFVPLQKFMNVRIQSKKLPEELRTKAVMANINSRGGVDVSTGGWSGDQFSVETRNFGAFFITTDTDAPSVSQYRAPKGNNYSNSSTMRFKISDKLSGIKSYNAYVDGQWILLEYDAKYNLLTHQFDEHILPGKHSLRLTVLDNVDNQKELTFDFTK